MISLVAAALLFVGIHFLISGTALRGKLVAGLGERSYRCLFSALSLGAVVWLAISFPRAELETIPLWDIGLTGRWAVVGLMFIAVFLGVVGITTPNPTSVGQEKVSAVTGILRVTRHPFLMGVALWAAAHIVANGHLAALIFFGAFLILSLIGPASIDAKRRAASPEHWARFASATSILPFGAIFSGRNCLVVSELVTWRLGAAIVVYVALIALHPLIFSVAAWP